MAKIQKFEDLEIYQNTLDLTVLIYQITTTGKLAKDYGLKDQLTRAAISISNNIAEGFEYDNRKDFIKFFRYSKGSAGEVRNMLNLLKRIDFIGSDTYNILYDKVVSLSKQLYGFIQYLRKYDNQ
jgi:four helix bundle protein